MRAAPARTSPALVEIRRIAASALWTTAALILTDLARIPTGMPGPGGALPRPAEILITSGLIYAATSLLLALTVAVAALIFGWKAGLPIESPRSTAPLHAGSAVFAILFACSVAALSERAPEGRWHGATGMLNLMAAGLGAAAAAWLAARLLRHAARAGYPSPIRAALVLAPLALAALMAVPPLLMRARPAGNDPAAPTQQGLPDVLLIVADSLRADVLACCGGSGATPSLDALASRGVTITEAVATAPSSAPSIASLFTSLMPSELGGIREGWKLPAEVITIAGRFRSHGYATAGMVSSYTLSRSEELDRGFDQWSEEWDSRFVGRHPGMLAARLMRAFGWEPRSDAPPAAEIVDRGLDWLSRPSERPRFLFLNLVDPHDPYAPPDDVRGELGAPAPGEGAFGSQTLGAALRGEIKIDEPALRRAKSFYAAEAAYLDREVGRLLESVEDRLAAGKLIVAFTSSHGEEFLDHGSLGHGHTLYQELVRVPVIVARPGFLPEGRTVNEPVSIVDLGPTLLDLAGLASEPSFRGVSRSGLLSGTSTSFLERAPVLSEMDAIGFHTTRHWSRSARMGDWKVILTSTDVLGLNPWRREVFNLASDPTESEGRTGDEQSAWLEAWLREWIRLHPPTPGAPGSMDETVLARAGSDPHDD